jgi:hypothetical protein
MKIKLVSIWGLIFLYLISGCGYKLTLNITATPSITRFVSEEMPISETADPGIDEPTLENSTQTIPDTASPTSTPLPTLSPSEAEIMVTDLLIDNSDCEFPCWWGFIPGETDIMSFKSFIYALGDFAEPFIDENGVDFYIKFPVDDKVIRLIGVGYFDVERDIIEWININTEIDQEIEGGYEIEYGDPLYFEYLMRYSVAHFLSTYGEPSNVLVYISDSWWPLSLILYYQESGIFVDFQMPVEELGDQYKACPSEAVARLWLWSSDNNYPISEVLEENEYGIQYLGPAFGYITIEEATGIAINEFVDIFSDPTNTSCIQTPITLWE